MEKNEVITLEDRGFIQVNGSEAKDFLQNIVTSDIEKVTTSSTVFSSILTPQGKYLFEFFVLKLKDGYLLECEKKSTTEIIKLLTFYKLRSKVEILNLSNEFVVAAFSQEKFLTFDDAKDIPGFTLKYREDPIFLDPRNKQLGARLIINLEKLYLSLKKLGLQDSSLQDYYSHCHKLGIVPKNLNKLQNKLFGIECNFEELNGIDFKKGCYVGQENTARIKLKNKLSKRLLPISMVNGELTEGESIYYKDNEIGKVLIDKEYPFALVKYLDENFNGKSIFNTKQASIKIEKPDWIKN